MELIDISLPINEKIVTFENDPSPKFNKLISRLNNVGFETNLVQLLTHTGTHFDAPSHYFQGGKSVDEIPLGTLIGEGCVLTVTQEGTIQEDMGIENKIVLLKTGEGANLRRGIFNENYITPKNEIIKYLIHHQVRAVGIDTLSIDKFTEGNASNHSILLKEDIPIIEGLYLEKTPPGEYFCVLLPLNLQGLDGAPGRCVLIKW